jgi:hypothetical protein
MLCALVALAAVNGQSAWGEELDQPDCTQLEQWVAGHDPDASIEIAPKVQLDALLKDELVVPLFGRPVLSWKRSDFNLVKRWLNDCRKAANKRRDREMSQQLYQGVRAVSAAVGPLNRMQSVRQSTEQKVQWLIDYRPVPQLPELLALAEKALQGEDVAAQLDPIQIGRGLKQHVRSLQQAPEFLPATEIEPLIGRLSERRAALESELQDTAAEMEAVKKELAEVPISAEGLAILDRLAQAPVLAKLSRGEAASFQEAVQQKRNFIYGTLRQRAAEEAAAKAAQPIDIATRLGELLVGTGVRGVSIRGLRPGVGYEEAKSAMEKDWGFKTGAGGDLFKEFAPTRRDLARYTETDRRDGGLFNFETMRGTVGWMKFTEHYAGPLDVGAVLKWLTARFGKPAEQKPKDDKGTILSWTDGGAYLQVTAADGLVELFRSAGPYRSMLAIELWSKAWVDYLAEAKRRCDALRQQPMSQLSIDEAEALASGCKTP